MNDNAGTPETTTENYASLQKVIGPTNSTDLFTLMEWCSHYEKFNKYPVPVWKRFLIGQYQIYQGMEWTKQGENGLNVAESYCACFLHFIMVGQRMNIGFYWPTQDVLTWGVYCPMTDSNLLYNISKFTQQFLYWQITNGATVRKSRFSRLMAERTMMQMLQNIIARVPKERRSDGIYHASRIMTGQL